jgi:predicted RecA/RadA family phage recombinase
MTFVQANIKNPTRSLKEVPKASATVMTKGYVLDWSSGLAILGTSSTVVAGVIGVCNKTIAAADAETVVPVIELFQNDVWIADSTNNSDATHNGQKMVLGANGGIVNNTGTTSTTGIVQQVGVYGAAADKKILVRFLNTA